MTRKTIFFEGSSWLKFNNYGLALGTILKFYTSLSKELKLKVKRFWGLILTFEVAGEKLVGRPFCPSPILNRVNDISNDLQKLLKYFNGTAIFTSSFFLFAPSATVLLIRFALYLNEGALSSLITFALATISSLLKFHKLPEVSEELSLYLIKLYIDLVILIKSGSSTRVPSISVEHFLNGAQFLNTTCFDD